MYKWTRREKREKKGGRERGIREEEGRRGGGVIGEITSRIVASTATPTQPHQDSSSKVSGA